MFVEIGADLSGLKRGIVEAGDSVKSLGGTIEKHGMAIGGAMTGIGFSALAVSYKCVESFKNIDSAMAGVRKTTGMTKEEIAILKDEFVGMSKTMPNSATELAGIGAVAGQLGISGKDNIMEFTSTIAKMSTAFDMPAEAAATAMAKMSTVYGTPIKEVGRLGSAVNVLGNTTAAKESEIMNFSMSLGAASKQLGFGATDSLAMGATLISMGMDASDAGTRLNSAFTAMGKNTEQAAALLGITEDAFKQAFGADPMAVLQSMIEELGKIQDPLERNTAASEVFGTVGAKAINGLSASLPELNKNMAGAKKGFEENTSLTSEFANATDTYASKQAIANNTMDAAAQKMGEAMAPAMLAVADATGEAADFLSDLPDPLQQIAGLGLVAGGGVLSVAGPLAMLAAGAPGAIGALGGIAGGVKALGLAFLTNPIFLAIALIIGIIYLLYKAWTNNWGGIRDKTAAVWEALKAFFDWLIGGIMGAI